MRKSYLVDCCKAAVKHVTWETARHTPSIPGGDGWHMLVEDPGLWDDDRTIFVPVRFCPFCGKELVAGGESR